MSLMYFVVGSGPTGVAATAALLDRGVPVTMLDVGVECEPDRMAVVQRMATRDPEQWSTEDLEVIRGAPFDGRTLRVKLSYGSAFAYATEDMRTIRQEGTSCLQSHAKGGLSNVWGAAVLPNVAGDLDEWPVTLEDIAPHYASVARLMPIAGVSDELEARFPFYAPPAPPLRPSRLASALLARLRTQRRALETAGIVFGQSRLAVKAQADEQGQGCRYTGLCLTGCPYFAVWNASTALEALRRRPGFTYRSGLLVERLDVLPDEGGVRIQVLASDGSGRHWFVGRRAMLACGPVSTTRIVIDSLRAYDRIVSLQWQPYFLLPLIAMRSSGHVVHERLHTLSQLFIEVTDPRISARTVHLQVYTFNEFIRQRVQRATEWLGPLRRLADRTTLGRLLVIQGYLHSCEAPAIRVTSARDPGGGRAELTLTAQPSDDLRRVVRRVVAKLARHSRQLGALPLMGLLEIGLPGDGNHVGGSFPIRRVPGEIETDLLGQLRELPGVHIVDSSTLPSLAATTFTYTAMAHAHRIADAAARMS